MSSSASLQPSPDRTSSDIEAQPSPERTRAGAGLPLFLQNKARSIQAKGVDGASGDPFEDEAERVAQGVMRMHDLEGEGPVTMSGLGPRVQRLCATCGGEHATGACPGCHEAAKNSAAPESTLERRSGGAPLSSSARSYFEPRFGYDFGDVRVHTDAAAAQSARELGADAYTVGQDIVFGAQRDPNTHDGQRVMAHELAHVVQQSGGGDGLTSLPHMVQRYCDPAIQTCLPGTQGADTDTAPVCIDAASVPTLPPVQNYSTPTECSVDVDVAGPSGQGGANEAIERLRFSVPVLHVDRRDYYIVPASFVFRTIAEAQAATCTPDVGPAASGPSGPESGGPLLPEGPQSSGPAILDLGPAPFQPGERAYTLDGPIEILSATADYVVTNVYTKFAVGAGSTTLVWTEQGPTLIDAGMQQVGGQINSQLADAVMQRLEEQLAGVNSIDVMLTHLHNDHTNLLPRVYARWQVGVLRVNALQALLPATRGTGTRLEQLAREMIEARRARVEGDVRTELTSRFGPWDLYTDADARQRALDVAVRAEVQQRMAAMTPTAVRLAIPSGGGLTLADAPLGTIGLPPGFAPDASPITRGAAEPGLVTLLDPGAGGVAANLAAGIPPGQTGAIDTGSSTYVMNLPTGGRLFVIADQRAADIENLRAQFETQLASLGQPEGFYVYDATHHGQHGFGPNDAIVRAQQLADMSRALSEIVRARQASGARHGDVVIVSVHGSPATPGLRSLVDPGVVYVLRSLGFEVVFATGGGSLLQSAQDVSVIDVSLGADRSLSMVAGTPYPGARPTAPRVRHANDAMLLLETRTHQLRQELAAGGLDEGGTRALESRIRDAETEYSRIRWALEAYLHAIDSEIGRSTRSSDPTHSRSATGPADDAVPPLIRSTADALDRLLVSYPAPRVDEVPIANAEALAVIGKERIAAATPESRALLLARQRVADAARGLRASSPPEARGAVATLLEGYRTTVVAAIGRAPAGSREILEEELRRIDVDLTRMTGLSTDQLASLREAVRLADQARRNTVKPALLTSPEELTNGEVTARIIRENGGVAAVGGQLYRLHAEGRSVTVSAIPLQAIAVPRPPLPSGGGGAGARGGPRLLPGGGSPGAITPYTPIQESGELIPEWVARHPNIINFSGYTVEIGQRTIEPTPSEPLTAARPGELVIRGASNSWVLGEAQSGRAIAGAFEGGEWWRYQGNGVWTMEVDAEGNVRQEGGTTYQVRIGESAEYGRRMPGAEESSGAGGPGGGTKAVAVGVGIIVVANEILGGIGRVYDLQNYNIERARARLQFWIQFGANPTSEMRTQNTQEVLPRETQPSTGFFAEPVYHYVTSIDSAGLGRYLDANIHSYQDLVLWLDLGAMLGTISRDPPIQREMSEADRRREVHYYANVEGPAGSPSWKPIDITNIIRPIEQRTLGSTEQQMRRTVANLSDADRSNIFRIRNPATTLVYRYARGSSIGSSSSLFGPNPWVRRVGGAEWSFWQTRGARALVVPANADAQRSALVSAYQINKPIQDVLKEVRENNRPVTDIAPAGAEGVDIRGFVAGPRPPDLGVTRYYRHPQYPDIWTVAIGQLDQFWIDPDDLEPVPQSEVQNYIQGSIQAPELR